ncbi:NAD-dependent epimerase/dehydratase family protein [Methylomonas sp. YC3]
MKVLILGSTGFIGRNLSEQLDAGKYQLLTPKRQQLNLLDFENVQNYLSETKPDVVINCTVNINSVHENMQVFCNLEANNQYYGKMLHIGSGAEYDGKHYIPYMAEDYFGKYVPSDIYGLSKYCIGKIIETSDKPIYNLRVFAIFGKYEDHSRRFISNNLVNVIRGQKITVNQNSVFDYLYVNDFVKIIDAVIGRELKFKSYNLCTSRPVELTQLAEYIKNVTQTSGDINVVNPAIKATYLGDNGRLVSELGAITFTDFPASIASLYHWYLDQFKNGLIDA